MSLEVGVARDGLASAVVHKRLREQLTQLKAMDPEARAGTPDAVHRMRVSVRRLRSALATFRPLLDTQRSEPLREELKWFSGVLAGPRDAEVMRDRLNALVAGEHVELVLGPVARRLDDEGRKAYRQAHDQLTEVMESDRYVALLRALDAFVETPSWTSAGEETAGEALVERVRHEWKRLRRRALAAEETTDSQSRYGRLHEVRKAAKRARYAAEALEPLVGDDADRFVKATERLQSVLGEVQDSAVAREMLRRIGVEAHLAGENGFTYGLLHGREQARSDAAEVEFASAWRKVSRKKVRRWMRDAS